MEDLKVEVRLIVIMVVIMVVKMEVVEALQASE